MINQMNNNKKQRLLLGLIAIAILALTSCAPPQPLKPWSSSQLSGITFEFKDTDPDGGEVSGDVVLDIGSVAKITGATHYIVYWSGSASSSGKGEPLADPIDINFSGTVLYKVPANTKIPSSRNEYFLLFVKDAKNAEVYTGASTSVEDDGAAKKAAEAEKAETAAVAAATKAEAEKAEAVKAEAEKAKAKEAESAVAAGKMVVRIENILFDFDRAEITPAFKRYLQKTLENAENLSSVKMTIEGHCDERGSNEYNLALGERRAHALKRYLISLGVLEENIDTLSYGEEKPADPRHSEDAWRKNRRANTEIEN